MDQAMTTIGDLIAESAHAAIDFAGTEIIYHSLGADGEFTNIETKAMPVNPGLSPLGVQGNEKTRSVRIHDLKIVVSQTDVPVVNKRGDEATVPGKWLDKPATVRLRVIDIEKGRIQPGAWVVALKG